jgi:hypothetical protein
MSSPSLETFAAFISEECFGRQPMTKYAHPRAKKLFLRHLSLFLEYRCENLYGAPALLPNLVRNVVEDFMTAANQTSEAVRAEYMGRVCDAIRHHYPGVLNLATKPTSTICDKAASDPIKSTCLAIAICMKDKQLVTHYLSHGASVWKPTAVFRSPLIFVVMLPAVDFLPQLLKHAKNDLRSTKEVKPARILYDAIYLATTSEDWETAITLIDWWYQHYRKPQPYQVAAWVGKAVRAHATKFLHRVLDQDLTAATTKLLVERLFDSDCISRTGSRDFLAEAMIDRKLLDVSQFYTNRFTFFSRSLLTLAVISADIQLAKLCLKTGMSADGLRNTDGKLENPIIAAVCKCDEAMVKLLLDHGADPTPAQSLVSLGDCRPGIEIIYKIKTLIRKAVKSRSSEATTDV